MENKKEMLARVERISRKQRTKRTTHLINPYIMRAHNWYVAGTFPKTPYQLEMRKDVIPSKP